MECYFDAPDVFCSCQEDGLELDSKNSNLISLKDFQFIYVFQRSRYGDIKKAQFTAYLPSTVSGLKEDQLSVRFNC